MSDVFQKLEEIDVTQKLEKKGRFSYLSWSDAVTFLLREAPDATWEVTKTQAPDGTPRPFYSTGAGYFVEVSVTVGGVTRTQIHPVLDNSNKPIEKPNSFHINTTIQRCLVKAIALHGLGLGVYRGEDLPTAAPRASKPAPKPKPKDAKIEALKAKTGGVDVSNAPDSPPDAPDGYSWVDLFDGTCVMCDALIESGHRALQNQTTQKTVCETCGTDVCNKAAGRKE